MAKARNASSSAGPGLVVAVVLALPALAAPFVVRMLQSSDQAIVEETDPLVERARRTILQLDENLSYTKELRKVLADSGGIVSAEGVTAAAEASPGESKGPDWVREMGYWPPTAMESTLRKGDELHTDKLLDAMDRAYAEVFKKQPEKPAPKGMIAEAKSPAQAFKKLESQIAANVGLLKSAESDVKEAISKLGGIKDKAGQDIWANRVGAMVAWMRGRVAADQAWLDRWRAAELRTGIAHDVLEIARLEQLASATESQISKQAVDELTAAESAASETAQAAQQKAGELKSEVDRRLARIAELRKKAHDARTRMAQMDLKPFRPANRMRAGAEFDAFRIQYESLSDEARQAEASADSLERGALEGAKRVDDASDELIHAAYEGGTATSGLVELQDRLDASQSIVTDYQELAKSLQERLSALQAEAAALKTKAAEARKAGSEIASRIDKRLKDVAALMQSARSGEEAARKAFIDGERLATAAQTAAKERARAADEIQQKFPDSKAERLAVIRGDKHTEIGALVLAASLDWAAAETYVAAIDDVSAQERLTKLRDAMSGAAGARPEGDSAQDDESKTGSQPGAPPAKTGDNRAEWRKAAETRLALAAKHLGAADTLIKSANYELEDLRVSGAALRWQVLQLQAAVDLLGAFVADDAQAVEDAKARARAKLEEALKGRDASPLLQDAAATLALLQPA